MADIYFDPVANDILVVNGDLAFTSDYGFSETMRQRIRRTLLTFLGEWFLDTNPPQVGVPYFQSLFEQKLPTIELADTIFRTALINIDGIEEVNGLDFDYDTITRRLTVAFIVTANGETIEDVITI